MACNKIKELVLGKFDDLRKLSTVELRKKTIEIFDQLHDAYKDDSLKLESALSAYRNMDKKTIDNYYAISMMSSIFSTRMSDFYQYYKSVTNVDSEGGRVDKTLLYLQEEAVFQAFSFLEDNPTDILNAIDKDRKNINVLSIDAPPGTGKTTTVAAAIFAMHEAKNKSKGNILLAATKKNKADDFFNEMNDLNLSGFGKKGYDLQELYNLLLDDNTDKSKLDTIMIDEASLMDYSRKGFNNKKNRFDSTNQTSFALIYNKIQEINEDRTSAQKKIKIIVMGDNAQLSNSTLSRTVNNYPTLIEEASNAVGGNNQILLDTDLLLTKRLKTNMRTSVRITKEVLDKISSYKIGDETYGTMDNKIKTKFGTTNVNNSDVLLGINSSSSINPEELDQAGRIKSIVKSLTDKVYKKDGVEKSPLDSILLQSEKSTSDNPFKVIIATNMNGAKSLLENEPELKELFDAFKDKNKNLEIVIYDGDLTKLQGDEADHVFVELYTDNVLFKEGEEVYKKQIGPVLRASLFTFLSRARDYTHVINNTSNIGITSEMDINGATKIENDMLGALIDQGKQLNSEILEDIDGIDLGSKTINKGNILEGISKKPLKDAHAKVVNKLLKFTTSDLSQETLNYLNDIYEIDQVLFNAIIKGDINNDIIELFEKVYESQKEQIDLFEEIKMFTSVVSFLKQKVKSDYDIGAARKKKAEDIGVSIELLNRIADKADSTPKSTVQLIKDQQDLLDELTSIQDNADGDRKIEYDLLKKINYINDVIKARQILENRESLNFNQKEINNILNENKTAAEIAEDLEDKGFTYSYINNTQEDFDDKELLKRFFPEVNNDNILSDEKLKRFYLFNDGTKLDGFELTKTKYNIVAEKRNGETYIYVIAINENRHTVLLTLASDKFRDNNKFLRNINSKLVDDKFISEDLDVNEFRAIVEAITPGPIGNRLDNNISAKELVSNLREEGTNVSDNVFIGLGSNNPLRGKPFIVYTKSDKIDLNSLEFERWVNTSIGVDKETNKSFFKGFFQKKGANHLIGIIPLEDKPFKVTDIFTQLTDESNKHASSDSKEIVSSFRNSNNFVGLLYLAKAFNGEVNKTTGKIDDVKVAVENIRRKLQKKEFDKYSQYILEKIFDHTNNHFSLLGSNIDKIGNIAENLGTKVNEIIDTEEGVKFIDSLNDIILDKGSYTKDRNGNTIEKKLGDKLALEITSGDFTTFALPVDTNTPVVNNTQEYIAVNLKRTLDKLAGLDLLEEGDNKYKNIDNISLLENLMDATSYFQDGMRTMVKLNESIASKTSDKIAVESINENKNGQNEMLDRLESNIGNVGDFRTILNFDKMNTILDKEVEIEEVVTAPEDITIEPEVIVEEKLIRIKEPIPVKIPNGNRGFIYDLNGNDMSINEIVEDFRDDLVGTEDGEFYDDTSLFIEFLETMKHNFNNVDKIPVKEDFSEIIELKCN